MTTPVKNKEHMYNIKINEEGDIHKLSDEEYQEIVKKGKNSIGQFVKGNRFGELQNERKSARKRMVNNFRKGEEMEILRDILMNAKKDNDRLAAAKLILAYKHGNPTQTIEQENFNHDNVEELPEEVQELLDSIGD